MNTKTILILAATAIFSFILGKLIQKLKDNKLIKKEREITLKETKRACFYQTEHIPATCKAPFGIGYASSITGVTTVTFLFLFYH